jgi:DNA polymerase-1
MPAPAPLLLADIPWLLYRSFFALPSSITDARGRSVNALLGTVNALLNVIDSRPPDARVRCVVGCTGAEEAAYRVALYSPYHAHREPMPAELRRQWDLAPELLQALGWVVETSANLEADDVMFSLAREEEAAKGRALLFTGDRDLYGAVSEAVSVVEVKKGGAVHELGVEQVRERYGVEPAQVADFIALRGDPSDGLPGARGIGAKTAAALLAEHGSLNAVLEAAHDLVSGIDLAARVKRGGGAMSARAAAALVEQEPLLRAFGEIATLQRIDVARPADAQTDYASGARAAREHGMERLAKRLEGLAATATA